MPLQTTPVVAAPEVQIPQPPGRLTLDELGEWNDLAPQAAREGTLNDSTALALRDLCQLRVLKDRLLRRVDDEGDVVTSAAGNLAAHPLLTRITTLSQRIEAAMLRFKLSPVGRELAAPATQSTDDGFLEFDAPPAPGPGATTH